MAGKLSFLQEEALVSLHNGHHFGIDRRTERGLLRRGLIRLGYWNDLFPELPFLTAEGMTVAAELDAAWRRREFERRVRGARLTVIDGGRA